MEFEQWLEAVDKEVLNLTEDQIGLESLSDWASRDCFNDELSPKEGAMAALSSDDIGEQYLLEMGLL